MKFPEWDTDLFLFINKMHTAWLDPVMAVFSTYGFWFLCFLIIVLFLFNIQKKDAWISNAFLIGSLLVNSLLNNILKLIVARPRPSNNDTLTELIHLLENPGISYSFFSAHSSNSFCLAVFTALIIRKKWYSIVIFIWATLVAYSRLYVGKHYPIDVIVGILFGSLIGYFGHYLYKRYLFKRK